VNSRPPDYDLATMTEVGIPLALAMTWWAVQTVVCIYLGYRTAKKTGRDMANWVFIGFLCAIPPIAGILIMIVAYLWYPPVMPRRPRRGHPEDRPREEPSRPRRRPRDPTGRRSDAP